MEAAMPAPETAPETEETDVLIVGAGPAGLTLALALQQAGVRHIVIDRLAAGQNTSRAAVVHAHTLEVLERVGVAADMVAAGLKVPGFRIRLGDSRLYGVDFAGLPSRYPFLLMIPQNETEAVLEARLAALGGGVRRGVTAVSVREERAGVTAAVSGPDGPAAIRARYAVGGDGMHSLVREAAGIAFEGGSYALSFVLADVVMDWPYGAAEASLFASPDGIVVVAPLPGGRFRVIAALDPAPETLGAAEVQAILDQRGPAKGRARVREVIWSSRFRIHHRLAGAFRAGRLFVMGDAAHVHSPAGGQGMNCGIADACVLGEILAGVIRGERGEEALDLYGRLRRPAAAEVIGMADRMTKIAAVRGAPARALRDLGLRILDRTGAGGRAIRDGLSGIGRRALSQVPPP
jgi:2-polyprenyl-6-methoxyphenol hydroxylase-like FAD-dependent oxidoreductase